MSSRRRKLRPPNDEPLSHLASAHGAHGRPSLLGLKPMTNINQGLAGRNGVVSGAEGRNVNVNPGLRFGSGMEGRNDGRSRIGRPSMSPFSRDKPPSGDYSRRLPPQNGTGTTGHEEQTENNNPLLSVRQRIQLFTDDQRRGKPSSNLQPPRGGFSGLLKKISNQNGNQSSSSALSNNRNIVVVESPYIHHVQNGNSRLDGNARMNGNMQQNGQAKLGHGFGRQKSPPPLHPSWPGEGKLPRQNPSL